LEKDLKGLMDEAVTISEFERSLYTSDFVPIPSIVKGLFKTVPDAVVKPKEVAHVARLLGYCSEKSIPVVARGGGSSGLFGAVPKRSGIVVDLTGLSRVLHIDRESKTVTVQTGITWWELDRALRGEGFTVKSYPSSARSATVGGWVAGTGLGIGSLKYGAVSEHVVRAEVSLSDGTVQEYERAEELETFFESEGLLGIITTVTLSVRDLPHRRAHRLTAFDHMEDLFAFLSSLLAGSSVPYAVEIYDGRYLDLLAAAGYETAECGKSGGTVLVTFEGSQEETEEGEQRVSELAALHKGDERMGAEREWQHRFNMLRVRRAVPTIIPSSVHIPVAGLHRFYGDLSTLQKRPMGLVGHIVSKDNAILMPMLVTDEEKSIEFIFALHTPWEIAELAFSCGGKPGGGLGVWNAPYKNRIWSKSRIDQFLERKQDLDPKGILNPGMWPDPPPLFGPALFRAAMIAAGIVDKILPSRRLPKDGTMPARSGFATCVQCGYCVNYCPTKGEWLSATPRGRILKTKEIFKKGGPGDTAGVTPEYVKSIFDCTLCGRCRVDCCVAVNSPEMWVELRNRIAGTSREPEGLKALAGVLSETHNMAGKGNDQRANWAKRLKLRTDLNSKEGAETVYFVGCVTSFYPMVQDVARSFAQVLQLGDVDFTLLGGEEWCCGYPLLSAGHMDEAMASMRHNVETVRNIGAKRLVVTCPGCYRMWKEEYPRFTGVRPGLEVMHSTELILRMLEEGRLHLNELAERVTYHDPCDLGRVSGIFEQPRSIIRSIPAIDFRELTDSKEYCNCCGSGGDLLASNQELSLSIAGRKVAEVLGTGAETLVTACPSCIRAVTMAKMAQKAQLEVLDIAQLVWRAVAKQ
jgi:Fe-S oxidoreductase/FAD/FMN-containing dehydrogenase